MGIIHRYAYRKGLFVIRQHGDSVELANDEDVGLLIGLDTSYFTNPDGAATASTTHPLVPASFPEATHSAVAWPV
jgi:hypothetical protein